MFFTQTGDSPCGVRLALTYPEKTPRRGAETQRKNKGRMKKAPALHKGLKV